MPGFLSCPSLAVRRCRSLVHGGVTVKKWSTPGGRTTELAAAYTFDPTLKELTWLT